MRTFIGVSLLTGVLMLPGVAMADSGPGSGVHVDPGSPAGKQYGFPVSSARGETSGKHNSAGNAGSQLFGAGVSPHKTSTHTATTSTNTTSTSTTATTTTTAPKAKVAAVAAHKKRAKHRKQVAVVSHSTSTPPPAKPVSASLASSHVASTTGGSSAWIALVGGGLLVLVLGTGAGLALKRRL
jgi:hypothetical protein